MAQRDPQRDRRYECKVWPIEATGEWEWGTIFEGHVIGRGSEPKRRKAEKCAEYAARSHAVSQRAHEESERQAHATTWNPVM